MFKLSEMVKLSHYAGERVEFVQGNGGNTSVKVDDGIMLVKASGFRLTDVTEREGFVAVDYAKLAASLSQSGSAEAKIAACVRPFGENPDPAQRPSVEAGFHALLKKYVLHTHSVYANLLCCSREGESLCRTMFGGSDFGAVWVPAVRHGFALAAGMREKLEAFEAGNGRAPLVFFLQNHGLVVHADTCTQAIELHQKVNDQIMKYFGLAIGEVTPVDLVELSEDVFESHTGAIAGYLRENGGSLAALERTPLWPDQVLFLNRAFRERPDKIETGAKLVYHTDREEAENLDGNVLAWIFVTEKLKELGLTASPMPGLYD